MLDENGFKRKTYYDLLEEMQEKAKELYGNDVNISSHSVLGIFIRVIAWFLSLIYELAERVYFSGFISQAVGVSLDRLGANSGIHRNPATYAMVELHFKGKPGYVINEGVLFSTENKISFFMIDVVKINDSGTGKGMAVSVDANQRSNVPANSIIVQVEPTEELFSVINPEAAAGGQEKESDKTYRQRIKISIKGNPGPPINGIITAVSAVSGIKTVNVVENNTMTVDKYSNPPKSVHIYCFGGTKEDIGDAIFSSVAGGIETVGKQVVTVEDVGGFKHAIRFDYTSTVNVFVKIQLTINPVFAENGKEMVQQTVVDYINSLSMGESVKYSYLYPIIYQIPGIVVADVKIGKTAAAVAAKDIPLSANESAQAIIGNIEVTAIGN